MKYYWKPITSVVFWGASFIATKSLLDTLSPLAIIYMRLLFGIFTVLVVAIKRKRSFSLRIPDVKGIILLAAISTTHLWIQVTGMQFTTASNTGWIIGIIPVIMAILAYLFFREKMTSIQVSGAFISFAGLIMLISKGDLGSIDFVSNKGDLLVLGSAFTWSFYSLAGKKVTLNYPPTMTILYLFITMLIIISPFTITNTNIDAVSAISSIDWLALVFLGVFCSGIAYVLWAQAMNELPAGKVGAFLYIEPFVTVFTAWLLLNEEITFLMMISGLIIIAGVILVNRK
ncbi:MAG: DMT family transporter [Melioribacteraceae bacterium]|nr:DMT family transporter [Melioribacteraceae bacterium]